MPMILLADLRTLHAWIFPDFRNIPFYRTHLIFFCVILV